MKIADIKIGEVYRHKDHPNVGYAKAVKVIKPLPRWKAEYEGYNEKEIATRKTLVKCEWSSTNNFSFALIKYFSPRDLILQP